MTPRWTDDTAKDLSWLDSSDASPDEPPGDLDDADSARRPAFAWGFIPTLRTVSMAQALLLAAVAAAGALVALSGAATVGLLVLSRVAAPANVVVVRPLSLHYEGGTATALAALLPELDHLAEAVAHAGANGGGDAEPGDAQLMQALQQRQQQQQQQRRGGGAGSAGGGAPPRFLPPGQAVAVAVALALPPQAAHTLLQVTGELLTAEGRLLARRSATWLAAPEGLAARWGRLLLWPLYLARLGDDSTRLQLQLFGNYSEPPGWGGAVLFRARLSGRTPAEGAPSVYRAQLVLRRLLTWRERALAALAPGPLLTLTLLALGGAMLVGGGGTCAACAVAAYILYCWGAGGSRRSGGPTATIAASRRKDGWRAGGGAGGGGGGDEAALLAALSWGGEGDSGGGGSTVHRAGSGRPARDLASMLMGVDEGGDEADHVREPTSPPRVRTSTSKRPDAASRSPRWGGAARAAPAGSFTSADKCATPSAAPVQRSAPSAATPTHGVAVHEIQEMAGRERQPLVNQRKGFPLAA